MCRLYMEYMANFYLIFFNGLIQFNNFLFIIKFRFTLLLFNAIL